MGETPGRPVPARPVVVVVAEIVSMMTSWLVSGLTSHGAKERSWTALRALEEGLAHLIGDKWTEKRR